MIVEDGPSEILKQIVKVQMWFVGGELLGSKPWKVFIGLGWLRAERRCQAALCSEPNTRLGHLSNHPRGGTSLMLSLPTPFMGAA